MCVFLKMSLDIFTKCVFISNKDEDLDSRHMFLGTCRQKGFITYSLTHVSAESRVTSDLLLVL